MTTKDKEFLMEMAKAMKPPKSEKSDLNRVLENVYKLASTMSIAAIMWIFGTLNQVKQDVSNIKIENQYTKEAIQNINAYTSQPRFTKENFDTQITPIINSINKNTAELNARNSLMESVSQRLLKLEYTVEELKK